MTEDLALIQTVDFFTPVVDDPFRFGQIAAANALSDVYAMGGVPKTAMNLVAFPLGKMPLEVLRRIIQGGLEKLKEADVVLVGGHSVEDDELKYGLSVTGLVHPDRILTKKDLRLGDRLILTKPLGTGVINTAVKGGIASGENAEGAVRLMAELNRTAAEVMAAYPVHACTDVTGFGLLGHLAEMVEGTGLGVRLRTRDIPLLPGAAEYGRMGLFPAGAFKNREFREGMVDFGISVDGVLRDLLFDPQTSGGLLICVASRAAEDLLSALLKRGVRQASIIGEVSEEPKGRIDVS